MKEKKKLNLFDVFSLGLGGAVGSGIFVMLGLGIGVTGRSIVIAVTVGCVYMLMAYLSHVIVSSMFVVPGGYYDIQSMLFPPALTGISGIFVYMSGLSMAMTAIAMVQYIGMIFPIVLEYSKIASLIVITLFFLATMKGSKFVAILGDIMLVILLVAIGLFVFMGLPKVQPGFFSNADGGFFLNGTSGVFQAIALMGFACQGATGAPTSLMLDTKNARRTTPLAILLVTLSLAVIYGLMSVVAAGVLPLDQVIGQNLAAVAHAVFPEWLYVVFILGGAVFAIATTLLSTVAMMGQPCLQIANDGWVPAVFKRTNKSGYPYVVQGFFFIVAVFTIFSGFSLEALVSLTMIPQMLINAYINFAMIRFVKKYPEQWKTSILHMPQPVFAVVCTLSTLCALMVAYNLFITLGVKEMITCIAIILICVVVALFRLKTGAVKTEDLEAKREKIIQSAISATEI